MVYRTDQADLSLSIIESRSSEKIAEVFEPSSDSDASRSYERRSPQSLQSLFDNNSFDSSRESDEVKSMSSGYLSDNFDSSSEGEVKVVNKNRDDLDDPSEDEEFEDDAKETTNKDTMSSPTTVILLQHIIDRTDDADAQFADAPEDLLTDSCGVDECQKNTRTPFPFHQHKNASNRSFQGLNPRPSARRFLFSALKKRKGSHRCQPSTTHCFASKKDTGPALNKSSQGVICPRSSQHFLASALAKKKGGMEEKECYNSDDDDSRENTEDITDDLDFETSIDSQPNGEWSRSANAASSLSPSNAASSLSPSEWSEIDSDYDQEVESSSVDCQELRKRGKQERSLSLQPVNVSKRGRSGDTKSIKEKPDKEETNGKWSRSVNPATSLANFFLYENYSDNKQESESDFFSDRQSRNRRKKVNSKESRNGSKKVDNQDSRKGSKQARSLSLQPLNVLKRGRSGDEKSVKSKRSLQSLNLLKRGRSGEEKSAKSKRDEENEDTKTVKTNNSWFRRSKRKKTPKDANELKSKRTLSLFRKPVSHVKCEQIMPH